jgi:hypothetical protein
MSKGLVVAGYCWVQQTVDAVDVADGCRWVLLSKRMMTIKRTLTLVASQCWVGKERSSKGRGGVFILNFCQALWIFADTGAQGLAGLSLNPSPPPPVAGVRTCTIHVRWLTHTERLCIAHQALVIFSKHDSY